MRGERQHFHFQMYFVYSFFIFDSIKSTLESINFWRKLFQKGAVYFPVSSAFNWVYIRGSEYWNEIQ